MPLVFACGVAHAPGIVGWPAAAPEDQRERFQSAYRRLGVALRATRPDAIVVFAAEHWANFFLNNYPAFCIGRAARYVGPLEESLNIPQGVVQGDADLARELLSACYERGLEPALSDELVLDHGVMVPLHFLTPERDVPLVPVIVNALAPPLPTPQRCFELGTAIGAVARSSDKRIAVVASGGLSHHPGTPRAGEIDTAFDQQFLAAFCSADLEQLRSYTYESISPAGFGAQEIRNWIAVAAVVRDYQGHVLAYEPVTGWSTGCAVVQVQITGRL
jgi:2,3-dihydroxyphenylpropionate 1,2-dioxygenase